ncbi:MAG: MgtC/SapB family protein [Bacteroidota bacterium]|nr:MgtC/SapB family protein [Bacteroidota bacterium]
MEPDLIIRLAVSLVFGAVIGFEREYRSKAAGFRTITIITIGATLFTILSQKLGIPPNQDRIASNIITGIGFIGAGVIFKDNYSVSGLTTAATIWIAAAIGMAIGVGEFILAGATLVLSMIVLGIFEKVQNWIDALHREQLFRINYHLDYEKVKTEVEKQIVSFKIGYKVVKCQRGSEDITFYYNLSGSQKQLEQFTAYLLSYRDVKSFEE